MATLETTPLLQISNSQRTRRTASIPWLLPFIFLTSISRRISFPYRALLVYRKLGCGNHPCTSDPDAVEIAVVITTFVCSALTTGWWSRLSDLRGRKLLMMLPIIGTVLAEVSVIIATAMNLETNKNAALVCILVGAAIDGLLGGYMTSHAMALAYAFDCTPHASRSKVFSVLKGFDILGNVFANPFGILLLLKFHLGGSQEPQEPSGINLYLPSITSLALALVNIIYVAYWLPESLPTASPVQSPVLRWSISRFYPNLKTISATVASPITMLTPERSGREPYMMILGIVIFLFALDNGRDDADYGFLRYIRSSWYAVYMWFTTFIYACLEPFSLILIFPMLINYIKKRSNISANTPLPSLATSLWFDYRLACGLILVHALTRLIFVTLRPYTLFPLVYSITVLTYTAQVVLYSIGALYLESFGRTSESGALFGALSVLVTSGKTLSWYIFDTKSRGGTPQSVSWILADLSLTAFVLLIPAAMKLSQEIVRVSGEEESSAVLGNESTEGEPS